MPHRPFDQRIVVGIIYVSAMFMTIMDGTIVNVALPTLSRQFAVPTTSIDAVVISYLVSLAVCIPASGWLGDRFGTRRIFLLALVLFTLASALCGLAPTFPALVLFRILQGMGGGMLTPVGQAMLFRTYPPDQRVQASRVLTIPTVFAPALGPVVGGVLIEQLSWRWAFYVNVPIGLAAFLVGLLFLQEHREPTAGRFDLPGFVLAGSGFALVMYALSEGPSHGWTAPGIVVSAVVGILALGAFVAVELRARAPLIQLRLLGNRLFRTTNLVTLFSFGGFIGVLFVVPLFLQLARGESPLVSGLTTFPEALGVVFSMQIVARLYPRVGPRRLMAGGLVGVAAAMTLLCLTDLTTSLWVIRLLLFLTGAGMAYVFLPSQAAGFATISSAETGRASTLANVQRQLGGALGVAVLSSVLAAVGPTRRTAEGTVLPHLAAYHAAFVAAAGFALIAALIAWTVPDRDAAATMRPRDEHHASANTPADAVVMDGG